MLCISQFLIPISQACLSKIWIGSVNTREENCVGKMSSPSERYQKLGLRESLQKCYRYPIACKELSFILREAFHQIPKSLQSIIFEDTLFAFRLLPEYACYCFSFFNPFCHYNYRLVSLIKLAAHDFKS